MNELLEKINQTFDNSINTSNEDVSLQLRIIKGNINTLFREYMSKGAQAVQTAAPAPAQPAPVAQQAAPAQPKPVAPVAPVTSTPTPQPVAPVAPKPAAPVAPAPVQPKPAVPSKNILIVDDSSIVRNFLQKAINGKYEVTPVSGGEEAIKTLGEKKVDLILLDLMMPGIDGFGVLEHLKVNNNTTPVVIISGDTTKETIDRAFTYNVVDMIEKPFSDKVIMEKIDRIIG